MDRKDFLKLSGAAGILTMIPGASHGHPLDAHDEPAPMPMPGGGCALIPQETAGPYPLDLSGNSTYFRSDMREDRPGVDHRFRLRIIGLANCIGMPNCRVDAWHCDVDGYYSGYTVNAHLGSQNNTSARWLRGIQMTDANGEVEFLTKFPGWYPGRTCHIHFQVFIGSMLTATSQFTYPIAEKNALLTSVAPYTTWGADPLDYTSDGIFSDGYALQIATLTFNNNTQEYESFLEVTINGTGSTGLARLEPETGGQFKLGQNFPNPYEGSATIPFTLTNGGDVMLELFDVEGRRAATILRKGLGAGEHSIRIEPSTLNIASANYLYQLSVTNANGTFRQCKLMTAKK
ncbi:MAG TPA: hypothetical protein PK760_02635 [Flavobacteriales bacterium]|nr:hypothetical protein [Flavobacteriales bacterium]